MDIDTKSIFEAYLNKKKAVLVAGLHGDEPAGNLAAQHYSERSDVMVINYVNPTGNRRFLGLDLNRNFLGKDALEKNKNIIEDIKKADPDIVICLHEDDRCDGVYMYCSPDLSYFLKSLLPSLDINLATGTRYKDKIESGVIVGGYSLERKGTLEKALTSYGISNCTIETPSKQYSLQERAEIQIKIINNILKHYR
jgi:predicted deacylase